MNDLVIDSSVAVKWFVPEANSDKALQILRDYRNKKYRYLAPNPIYAEYGNIIWKKRIFQGLSASDADFVIREFQNISFILTPITVLFDDTFKIAVTHQRTFYDSLYLALSRKENCEFVTADEKLYNAVKPDFSNIVLLADWK